MLIFLIYILVMAMLTKKVIENDRLSYKKTTKNSFNEQIIFLII